LKWSTCLMFIPILNYCSVGSYQQSILQVFEAL
jgi:hypothetical protein